MNIEEEVFKKSIFNFEKLLDYGFIKNNNTYYYSKNILNDSFKIEVIIDKNKVKIKVIDLIVKEEYISYRISEQNGKFVDDIRNTIKELLIDIKNKCCINNLFVFDQTNRIVDYIYKKYNDKPLFLFDDSSDCGVFKNLKNNKWYGIIMTIDKSKLDKNNNGKVEIINLKIDSEEIKQLLLKKGFYEAYHMNKKYWITLILDNSINDEEIKRLIDESYNNILKK